MSQDPLETLKAIAAHAPVSIQIFDAAGYSIFTNAQHTRVFGGPPPAEKCILNDEQAKKAGILPLVHKAFGGEPTVLPLFWYDPRQLKQLSAEAQDYVKAVGKKAAIETHMIPVFGSDGKVSHVVFFHKDVTSELSTKQEREQAVKERDDAAVLIRSVLDKTQAVIYIKDLNGKFLFVNGQFCRIFSKTTEEVLGKTGYGLFPSELADAFQKNDLQVQKTQSHLEIEETALHSDGQAHTYLSLKFPLHDSAGVLYAVCGISTDITQRRKLEQELAAAKRMEAIGLLAGNIAHDFGNLLTIMLLHADLLLRLKTVEPEGLRVSLEAIKAEGKKASLLIRQLLAFGRKKQAETRLLDLNSILFGMRSLLAGAIGEDIRFELEAADSVWPVVADPLHIEQIVTNLCLNARDAMPKGGRLRIRTANSSLSGDPWRLGKPRGDYVELSVSDTGCGMSPEVLTRIFEPFFTTKGEGTGLGLASVCGLVESNGGDILVASNPGVGTTFRVCLPRAPASAAREVVAPTRREAMERGTETVLLVEDQAALRLMTAVILRENGYKVLEAENGLSGLKVWRESGLTIDIIVTDIVMPEMSGAEMVRQLCETGRSGKPKALFVSGYSEERLSAHDLKQDSLHFLEKPYSASDLLSKIRSVLKE